jgi:hypothetical protein
MKKLFVFMLACGVTVSYASISYGWSHNEHQINTTGTTAYDVVKILDGDYEITEMMENDFSEHDYYHRTVNGKMQTVLRWWNGAVPDGDAGDVCFTAVPLGGSATHAVIIGASWTDQGGVPIDDYPFPAASAGVDFNDMGEEGILEAVVHLGNYQAGRIKVNADNADFWKDGDFQLLGEAAPIPIYGVKVAVLNRALTPETLNLENTIKGPSANQFFDVFTEIDVLKYNEDMSVSLLDKGLAVYPGQSVVMVVDQGNGNYGFFNFDAPQLSSCGETDDGILDIPDTSQQLNHIVTVPVRIQGTLTQVFSGGFDLIYDPGVLNYLDFTRGALAESCDMMSVADLGGGHLRIGYVDTNGNIAAGSYGEFIKFRYLVVGGIENESYPILMTSLKDDFEGQDVSGGCMTVTPICTGDLNGDGWISPEDASSALQCYLGTLTCAPCSDVNGDGQVTPGDALCILQKFVGLPSCLDLPIYTL